MDAIGEKTLEAKLDAVKAWLLQNNPSLADVPAEANLLGEGILDSFQFINFIMHVEHVRGSKIDRERVRPEAFRTLADIAANFLGE